MTSVKNIALWGSGRWAAAYLSALNRIHNEFNPLNILVISSRSLSSHPPPLGGAYNLINVNQVSAESLGFFDISIIVNSNSSHEFACVTACHLSHEILCEKPLHLSKNALKECLKFASVKRRKFWESMLPMYCDYFATLPPLLSSCSKLIIDWHDPLIEVGARSTKRHDMNISNVEDVTPHICSILRALGFDVQKPTFYTNIHSANEGTIHCYLPRLDLVVNCSRISQKRVRRIRGLDGIDCIFDFDFSSEPGKLVYTRGNLDLTQSFLTSFRSPILLQLMEFLELSPTSREMISIHSYLVNDIEDSRK
jgi:hypothetical protein